MKIKKLNKKANIKLATVLIIILLIFIIIKFNLLSLSSFIEGNLGNWQVSGYNRATGEITIPLNVNVHSVGKVGAYTVHNQGTPAINNQADCEDVGWSWRIQDLAPSDGYQCYLNDLNWMNGKTYTSNIICYHTCLHPQGCGTLPYGGIITGPYTPNFNGIDIDFTNPKGSDWLVECKGNIIVRTKPLPPELPQPTPPQPSGFLNILKSIWAWIKSIFTTIFPFSSIIGEAVVEPNTIHTYKISLTAPFPDDVWDDGNYQVQYANWVLVDKDQQIIQEGEWERVYGNYNKDVTITAPSKIDDFMLVAVITQYDMTFVSGSWTSGEEQIMTKEAINLKTEYTVTIPSIPSPSGFLNLINKFFDWLKNLFSFLWQ